MNYFNIKKFDSRTDTNVQLIRINNSTITK